MEKCLALITEDNCELFKIEKYLIVGAVKQ